MTIATLVSVYLCHLDRLNRKSAKQARSHASRLVIVEQEVESFDPDKYQETRRACNAKPATINREIEILKSAAKHWERTYNEKVPLRHIIRLPEKNVRQGFFGEDEWFELMKYLPWWLVGFCDFAYFTGWRKSEIAGLRWEWITFDEIRIPDSKNDTGRVIPLAGPIRNIIKTASGNREFRPTPWVFADPNGNQIGDFRKRWKSACKAAGLAGRLFHDFRRTAVRNMIEKGVDREVAKKITGHKTDSMFTRYQIVDKRQMTSALEKL
jgi:integrase